MSTAARSAARATAPTRTRRFGPAANGISMRPKEFDRAVFEYGWRYELVRGVLIVSPPPLEEERDSVQDLGYQLLLYRDTHPQGKALDHTLPEQTVVTGANRRRADRVIWAGLGRMPRRRETPTIVVEFISEGRRSRDRDYAEKRDEYLAIGVQEYWIVDRFIGTMTVYLLTDTSYKRRLLKRTQTYKTPLLPGFILSLGRLFAAAERWADDPPATPD
jgi:Uma2 family endonuclease